MKRLALVVSLGGYFFILAFVAGSAIFDPSEYMRKASTVLSIAMLVPLLIVALIAVAFKISERNQGEKDA